jgi:hypothetical protein
MGGGFLTKTSDFFGMYLMPFTLLLFDFKKKERGMRLLKWVLCALLAVGLANFYYSILRLSPFFHIVNDKNAIFVYPIKEWLDHPLRFLVGNWSGQWDWFSTYVTYPVLILMGASFFLQKKLLKEKILLFIYFISPFVALALFGRILYPRFIFFMTLPLLPLAALSLFTLNQWVKNRALKAVVVVLFLGLWVRADYGIISSFATAPIPKADLTQYSNDWPAGGGIAHIISYLAEESKDKKIYVASEGTFGSLSTYAVEIYLGDNRNVEKGGLWPIPADIPKDLLEKAQKQPVYMIFNETQLPPGGWPLKLIAKYQKGVGVTFISLYQVIPQQP